MRKIFITLAISFLLQAIAVNTTAFAAENPNTQDPAAMGQIIEIFMFEHVYNAQEDYYQGQRGVSNFETLSVTQLPNSYVYEIVYEFETFTGAHNPPFGKDTATFWVYIGGIWLKEYKHTEIPTLSNQ